jgi:predicted nucleotidyltransferase component of viral defense system
MEISSIQKIQKEITENVTQKFSSVYYLTGGTALAIYFNHRYSEDLDFFSQTYSESMAKEIMLFIQKTTDFEFQLDRVQEDPKLIPMCIYFLKLSDNHMMKVDFVQDPHENIYPIEKGMHRVEDIYFRKINAAAGTIRKEGITGGLIATGRQAVKDFFDLYYLSKQVSPLSDFFFEYFSYDAGVPLINWYKNFNRTDLKIELMDMIPGIDTQKVLNYMDEQILKKLIDKLIP